MKTLRNALLAIAATGTIATAMPAAAAISASQPVASASVLGADSWDHGRKHRGRHYDRGYRNQQAYYGEQGGRGARTWRGEDGRYYCRRDNGTTGLLIGGAVGGLAGHEIAGRGDRTLGTILGVAGGALLGREIDRGGSRCR